MFLCLLMLGCSSGSTVNPALTLKDPQAIEEATKRGIALIKNGGDPYTLFGRTTKQINERLGKDIIVRSASLCLPKDELAFRVAMAGDPSEEGAKRAANAALPQINRQVRFTVVLQLAKTRNPEEVTFELTTNLTKPYPPVAVEPPELISELSSALDPDITPMAVYGYNVYFATTGSPGFPAIDDTVSNLTLAINADGATSRASFSLASAMPTR